MYKSNIHPNFSQTPYRILRLFYYIGMLFVTLTILRFPFGVGITMSDWAYLVCYLLALLLKVFRPYVPSILTPSLVSGVFLFTISAILSSINAVDPSQSILNITKFLFVVVVWFWLSGFTLQDLDYIKFAVDCWLISAIICSAGALVQIIWGNIFPGMFSSWGRMAGLSQHPNEMGLISSIALIPLATKFFIEKPWQYKCLWLVGFIVTFIGLMLSASIAAIIGLTIAFVVWVAILQKRLKLTIVLILVIFAIGYSTMNFQKNHGGQSYIDRLISYQEEPLGNTTLGSRLEVYNTVISAIAKNMLIGRGFDEGSLMIENQEIHNMLLLIWYGGGAFAFLGILLVLISVWRMASHNIGYSVSKNQKMIAEALYASYIASIIIAMASPILYRRTMWVPSVLIVAIYVLNKRKLSSIN